MINYKITLAHRFGSKAAETRTVLAEEYFRKLVELTAHLRGPEGCPWDRVQDYDTLRSLLLEEAYEVVDAAISRDFTGMEEELGDLLFLVVFYSRVAEEDGRFAIDDVIKGVHAKLVRRHPHVFGDVRARNAGEALQSWQAAKKAEQSADGKNQKNSLLDGILTSLPSTLVANELGTRAAGAGFDWSNASNLLDKIQEEVEELRGALRAAQDSARSGANPKARLEEEVGDLLFTAANLARFLRFDSESCLRRANMKFKRRFQAMEQELAKLGKRLDESTIEEMSAAWDQVKAAEKHESQSDRASTNPNTSSEPV